MTCNINLSWIPLPLKFSESLSHLPVNYLRSRTSSHHSTLRLLYTVFPLSLPTRSIQMSIHLHLLLFSSIQFLKKRLWKAKKTLPSSLQWMSLTSHPSTTILPFFSPFSSKLYRWHLLPHLARQNPWCPKDSRNSRIDFIHLNIPFGTIHYMKSSCLHSRLSPLPT